MTMTTVKSAYPAAIEDLMPQAREMAKAEGLPSQNRLKETLHIGRPKAREVRDALAAEGYTPAEPATSDLARVGPRKAAMFADLAVKLAEKYPDSTAAQEAVEHWAPTEADPQPQPDPAPEAGHDTVDVPAVKARDTDTTAEMAQEVPVAGPPAPAAEPEPVAAEAKTESSKSLAVWPVLLLMLPATVAIWSGWVGLGQLAGFGPINPLPGIWDSLVVDTSITLPIGMETYSAYALYVWLSGRASAKAVRFARASAIFALVIGSAGQVAYHLIAAPDAGAGPVITAAVACIPVAVLGLGAALAHLVKNTNH